MPRTKEQFEQMRNATKEKIQTAAIQLFVQKGYGSTNVQEVADLAGISIGLLYRHYKSKEILFNELVDFAISGLEQNTELFESAVSPRAAIEQFVHEVWNDMKTGEQLANLLLLMSQSFLERGEASERQTEMTRISDNLFLATEKLIKKGQTLGEFRSGEPSEMVTYFYSTIHGLATMKMMQKGTFSMPAVNMMTSFLFREGE
ncbi:TetR/AcrR family transcriptional regulator [Paenibacillus sp. GCM10027627]|uniref:TetR/AcrR family transcriptional regulator n=1 Tax=unclassified Paenibacillus TaxID=185978 RepID=UPI00363BAD64